MWTTAGDVALGGLLLIVLVSGRVVEVLARAETREQQVAELAIERARRLGESLTAEERERTRLAGEIHDDALQELALAEIELRHAAAGDDAALARGRARLASASAALRRTLARIIPAAELHSEHLEPALDAMAAGLCEPAGLDWTVRVDPDAAPEDRTLVCSLARELMTNAVKHPAATRVGVTVGRAGDALSLEVDDDGRGFEPAAARRSGHVGLSLVENRARAAGGRLVIDSSPGDGTRAIVELPLPATSVPRTDAWTASPS